MGRGPSGARTRNLVERLRGRIPNLVLRTTVMTGHPGEGASEFEELLEFLGENTFDRLGVFAYSPEAETPAARLPRVTRREALRRRGEVLRRQRETARLRQQNRVGERTEILVEAYDARRNRLLGRSYGEAPEIDGHVRLRLPAGQDGETVELGEFIPARIVAAGAYDLEAVACGTFDRPEARGARGRVR
jgi:ribosomal protein S12 methylthiotransferase